MTIKDLKRGDYFKHNETEYKVNRKWLDDDRPLIAIMIVNNFSHRFYHEELEIEKIENPNN